MMSLTSISLVCKRFIILIHILAISIIHTLMSGKSFFNLTFGVICSVIIKRIVDRCALTQNLKESYIMRKILDCIIVVAIIAAAGYVFYLKKMNTKAPEPAINPAEVFSIEVLKSKAEKLSESAYMEQPTNLPDEVKNLSYDQHRDIRFKREEGPWYKQRKPFEIQFFHLGSLFQSPVLINEIVDGKVVPLNYKPEYFDFGKNHISPEALKNLGFAGFRLHAKLNSPTYYDELVAFLGASYFRALAKGQKYGLSARGLAIDTALQSGEEFPVFKEFWIERPSPKSKSIKIYALLDSKSVAGAYKFVLTPGSNTTMDVEAYLYPRKAITKLGVAPLTSMYLFGENTKNRFDDHRPEVHDSDGLLIHNGNDEWLWRPLDNSRYLRISSFEDFNPKGFGLMQRDHNPWHYLDFEAEYEKRPSVWVQPLENWGKGVVQLVEIPSIQEIHDNIVAYWIPDEKIEPGKEYVFKYRLNWCQQVPEDNGLAKIRDTYTGIGGVSGMLETEKRKFVINFEKQKGIKKAIEDKRVTAEVSTSEGKIKGIHLMYNPLTKGATIYTDFVPDGKTAELRAVLKRDGKNASEVWSYQWLP